MIEIASKSTGTKVIDKPSGLEVGDLMVAVISVVRSDISGVPTNFQKLIIRIKDNGTAQAITWGDSFQDGSVALPTTTVSSKTLMVGLIYDSVDSKWTCEATGSRA